MLSYFMRSELKNYTQSNHDFFSWLVKQQIGMAFHLPDILTNNRMYSILIVSNN